MPRRVICVFVVTQELLFGLSILKILIFKHLFFQLELLFVFDFSNSWLVFNIFLLLLHPHSIYPLICWYLWDNAPFTFQGVKFYFSLVVLGLISETKDEADDLNEFENHDQVDNGSDHVELTVGFFLPSSDIAVGVTRKTFLEVAEADEEKDTQSNSPYHSQEYKKARSLTINLVYSR